MRVEGKVGRGGMEWVEKKGESRLVAILISPFGAKCVSLGRGLSVLGWPARNQVSPPVSSAAVGAYFHPGLGWAHIHKHTLRHWREASCCYLVTWESRMHRKAEGEIWVTCKHTRTCTHTAETLSNRQWSCFILLQLGDQWGCWHLLICSNLCLYSVNVAEAGQEYCGIWPVKC